MTHRQTDRQAVGQSVSHCQRIPCTCLKLWQIADADSSVVLLSIDVKLGKTAESLYIHSNDKTCRQRFSCTHTHTHTCRHKYWRFSSGDTHLSVCPLQYCKEQDRRMLVDLYYQDDQFLNSGNVYVQESDAENVSTINNPRS